MKRLRMAAVLLLFCVGAVAFFECNQGTGKLKGKQPTYIRFVDDDGLERIGVDLE